MKVHETCALDKPWIVSCSEQSRVILFVIRLGKGIGLDLHQQQIAHSLIMVRHRAEIGVPESMSAEESEPSREVIVISSESEDSGRELSPDLFEGYPWFDTTLMEQVWRPDQYAELQRTFIVTQREQLTQCRLAIPPLDLLDMTNQLWCAYHNTYTTEIFMVFDLHWQVLCGPVCALAVVRWCLGNHVE